MFKKLITSSLLLAILVIATSWKDGSSTTYPVVIKFTSECCGVPNADPVYAFVKAFKKQHKIKKISFYKIGPLGREGEYDLAFPLKEMTRSQSKLFVTRLQAVCKKLKGKGKAEVVENEVINKDDLPGRASMEKQTL